ncbi:MAG: hypothetical protein IPM96_14510 [Ignavibacteria bacterium]|nr:hypothetical protein [Ignavibacteria bacterium]
MITSKYRIFFAVIFIINSILNITGCNEISQGLQREKFEFLYRMNTDATLLKDYTNGVQKYEDLDFYERNLSRMYTDILKMKTIEEYSESRALKENLLNIIEENINSVKSLKRKQYPPGEIIRQEYDVIVMKERTIDFLDRLNDEIVKVGRE